MEKLGLSEEIMKQRNSNVRLRPVLQDSKVKLSNFMKTPLNNTKV